MLGADPLAGFAVGSGLARHCNAGNGRLLFDIEEAFVVARIALRAGFGGGGGSGCRG
jgi:hypothetical protein